MAHRSSHTSALHGAPTPESLTCTLPSLGSIERTAVLVESHHEISRRDMMGREHSHHAPEGSSAIVREIHSEFKQLLWDLSIPPMFSPSRIFLHSDVIVPGQGIDLPYLNFLAEVRNSAGEYIVLTEHGWSVHRAGPAFSHMHASFSLPTQFFSYKLYSRDAFCEEIEIIRNGGLASLLGFRPRSFILETALDSIQALQGHLRPEASSFSLVEVVSQGDYSAVLRLVAPSLGAFEVSAQLVPQRWFLTCSARSVRF